MMKIKKDLFFSDLLSIKKGTKDGTIFNINKTYGNGTILMYKIIEGMYLACSELEFKDIVKISTAGNYCSDIIAIDYCIEGQCICNFRNSRIAFAQKGGSIYYAGKNHSLYLANFKGKLYKSITIFCYLNKIIDSLGKIFGISREKIEKCYNELSVKIDFLNVKTHDDVLILLNEIYKYIKCNNLELIKLRTIELFLLEINNYEKYNNQKKKDYTKGMINKMERIRNTIAQSYYKDYTIKDLAENEKVYRTDVWAKMVRGMENAQKAGRAQMARKVVARLPEYGNFEKMLDLGCGSGLIGMAVVEAHPFMKGVLFDRAPVLEVTKELVKKYELEDRVELIGGDFSTDSIGDNYDLIIASHVLYMTKNNMDVIMKKIYAALNPGGVFVSFHSVLTDEGTKPEKQVLSWLSTSMSEYNMTLDEEIISESALRVGFYSVKNSIDNEYTNIVIARKQRK